MSDLSEVNPPAKSGVATKVIIGVVIAFAALFLISILCIVAVTFLGASASDSGG